MNEQKEKMICFDIDQNKQKINYLMKKNKENEDMISSISNTIETNQTDLNGLGEQVENNQTALQNLGEQVETTKNDLTTISESVSSLNTAVANLQNTTSTGGGESFEECFPKSYDKMRWTTYIHRNNHVRTIPCFFCCKKFEPVKIKVKFTLENQTTMDTTTLELLFDEAAVYTDTHTWDGETTTHEYEIEHTFTSMTGGHMLEVSATTTDIVRTGATTFLNINSITLEIWGTNVEILTHRPDFQCFASPTKALVTTQVFDSLSRYSMQTPDENFSFDQANFKTFCSDYAVHNNPIPFIMHTFNDDGELVYSDLPSFAAPFFSQYNKVGDIELFIDITDDETEKQQNDASTMVTAYVADVGASNTPNLIRPYRVSAIRSDGLLWACEERESYSQRITGRTSIRVADMVAGQRLNNSSNTAPSCFVVVNADGTAYICVARIVKPATYYPKTDLGYGANPKVYVLPDNKVEVFLKYGNNTKRIVLEQDETDPKQLNIVSKEIIQNIQGYWKCFNGAHFERVGNEIRFFPESATTPTQTLKLFY